MYMHLQIITSTCYVSTTAVFSTSLTGTGIVQGCRCWFWSGFCSMALGCGQCCCGWFLDLASGVGTYPQTTVVININWFLVWGYTKIHIDHNMEHVQLIFPLHTMLCYCAYTVVSWASAHSWVSAHVPILRSECSSSIQFISWISAHMGRNCELRLSGTLWYMHLYLPTKPY